VTRLRVISLLVNTALCAGLATPSSARTLAAIKAVGTLDVGMTGDYAPFSFRQPGGKTVGADVTMARSLAKSLEVNLVIVPTTWKTLQADLKADKFDIAMGGVSVTPGRTANGYFSAVVLHDGKRPIVRCEDKDRYISTASINRPGVRVVVNPGGTNEPFAKQNFPEAHIEVYADNRTIFNQIVSRRADVMVTDGAEVDYQSRLHPGVLCPAAVSEPFNHFEKAYWMTPDPALRQAVDAWLIPRLRSGRYDQAMAEAAATP
jgi:cyclohexadienyl dehydratase